jgi:formamidopyrimidine-DNA glycosylase
MPELPDVEAYVAAIDARVRGRSLVAAELRSPFLLRTVDPPLLVYEGRAVRRVARLGKRVVLSFDGALHLVIHLMIAGRLQWRDAGAAPWKRPHLAAFCFESGTLVLTEAGSKRRASLALVRGDDALAALDRGGVEPLRADRAVFAERLRSENRTLKRALTDPRLVSGIGNAYSDEILFRARMSPMRLTRALDDAEMARLHAAVVATLAEWTARLAAELGGAFPSKVTAFRDGMAVHGRYREPCTVCGAPVQRLVHGESESNYCARCQTGGRILRDGVLSKLLKDDWPRTLDELAG